MSESPTHRHESVCTTADDVENLSNKLDALQTSVLGGRQQTHLPKFDATPSLLGFGAV